MKLRSLFVAAVVAGFSLPSPAKAAEPIKLRLNGIAVGEAVVEDGVTYVAVAEIARLVNGTEKLAPTLKVEGSALLGVTSGGCRTCTLTVTKPGPITKGIIILTGKSFVPARDFAAALGGKVDAVDKAQVSIQADASDGPLGIRAAKGASFAVTGKALGPVFVQLEGKFLPGRVGERGIIILTGKTAKPAPPSETWVRVSDVSRAITGHESGKQALVLEGTTLVSKQAGGCSGCALGTTETGVISKKVTVDGGVAYVPLAEVSAAVGRELVLDVKRGLIELK